MTEQIRKVMSSDLEMVRSFLLNVPSISDLDDNILKNGIMVTLNNDLLGFISYEAFEGRGVIRYFVFQKMLDELVLSTLFKELEKEAGSKEIKSLYCVVDNKLIQTLFESLDFKVLEKKDLYLDEKLFKMPNLNETVLMEHKIYDSALF